MRKLVLLLLVTLGLVLGSVPYEEGKDIGTEGAVETESTQTETEADEEEPTEKAVQVSEENTVSAVSDEEAEEQAKATTNSETKEEKEPKAVENKGQGEQSGRAYEPVQVQNNISDTADCPTSTQEVESEPVVAVRSYSPQSVVAKAIAKCQAGGMITTTDSEMNRILKLPIAPADCRESWRDTNSSAKASSKLIAMKRRILILRKKLKAHR